MDIHYEAQPSSVVSVPVASCGGRMPECTSTCERFTFFRNRRCTAVAWCFLSMFKAPWSLESRLVS